MYALKHASRALMVATAPWAAVEITTLAGRGDRTAARMAKAFRSAYRPRGEGAFDRVRTMRRLIAIRDVLIATAAGSIRLKDGKANGARASG